jgi:NADP-dependent alcohol dehydrogenase
LQDRQAEAILLTLIEEGPKVLREPKNYDVRANLMWCATQALNGIIGCGVPQDWASHMIGHELTALFGIDHGESLAVVLPAVLTYKKEEKSQKLVQYAERVWNIHTGSEQARRDAGIAKTEEFFRSLGIVTRFKDYKIDPQEANRIASTLEERGMKLGEKQNILRPDVLKILALCT